MSNDFFKVKKGLTVSPVISLPASSTDGSIVFDDNEKKFKRWSSSANAWVPLGEGSGDLNFLQLSNKAFDAESGITGWSTYKDAAQARPEDGTGGTPSVVSTISTTTTNPLSGTRSFLFAKGSGNGQGEGWSVDFQIDRAHFARVLQIEFDYQVESGTFVAGSTVDYTTAGDSDLIVYIYDIDNNQLIEPTTFRLYSNANNIADKFIGNFQTSANGVNYRLIFHVARTSTAAWTLKVDNIVVKPARYTYGTPITDWVDFPSVAAGTLITATTTNPTYGTVAYNRAQWRRVGGEMEIRWMFKQTSAGTSGSGYYLFNLPSGFNIDLAKFSSNLASSGNNWGDFRPSPCGAAFVTVGSSETAAHYQGVGYLAIHNSTAFKIAFQQAYAADFTLSGLREWRDNFFHFGNISFQIALHASVPIAGWSSSVKISEPMELRDVVCYVRKTISQTGIGTSPTKVTFQVAEIDTTNSFNFSTSEFIAPVSGFYHAYTHVDTSSSGELQIRFYVNNIQQNTGATLFGSTQFSSILNLRAGDRVDVRVFHNTGSGDIIAGPLVNFFIYRLPSSQALAQSETCAGLVRLSFTNMPSGETKLSASHYVTPKYYDSHNLLNTSTGDLIIPRSGLLDIHTTILFLGNNSGRRDIRLYLNNSFFCATSSRNLTDLNDIFAHLSVENIPVKAGDVIHLAVWHNASSSVHATGSAYNWVSWCLK